VRDALATLPWVEQGTIRLDFKAQELHFDLKDKGQFNEAELKDALKAQKFPNAEVRSRSS
jgi:hypothetical protein